MNKNTPSLKRTGKTVEGVASYSTLSGAQSLVPGPWSLVARPAVLLGVVVATVLSGCTNTDLARVKPWQRATLADYTMRPDRDPLNTAMAEHVYFSRETASGGRGVGGSGCGCN